LQRALFKFSLGGISRRRLETPAMIYLPDEACRVSSVEYPEPGKPAVDEA